jgi:hypothetical protein
MEDFIKKFFVIPHLLKHSDFNTKVKRMGKIVSISHLHIQFWQLRQESETLLKWLS